MADLNQKQLFTLNNSIYFLTEKAIPWGAAQTEAQTFGGNLVTINNPAEQTFLAGVFAGKSLWTGYNDSGIEGTFTWINDEKSAYTNWENGQPNNFNKVEDFAYLRANGSWDDGNGTDNLQGIIEITNPSTPILIVEDLGIIEPNSGNNEVSFQVRLFGNNTQSVTVNYTTVDGSAKTGIEYTATNGTLTFQPGEQVKTVTVKVNADTDNISNEKFSLNLSSPTNAILGDNTATGTIKELSEFVSFGDKTYLLSQAQNWGGAEVEARTFGGNLATIETSSEQTFLAGVYAGEPVWIGLSDSGGESSFLWSSGRQSAYTNWENGQPNNFNKVEDFAYLRTNGSWDDGNGADSLQGIIEIPAPLNLPLADFTDKQIFTLGDSLYFLTNTDGKWGQTQQEAQTYSGNLATINTPEEQIFLAGLFAGQNLWIGYSDAGEEDSLSVENTFSWISGEQSAYTNWENRQPDDFNNIEDFAYLSTNGSWDDGNGAGSLQGIVEVTNPTKPILIVEDLGIVEPSSGSSEVSFQVRLFGDNNETVTVNYNTSDDSAKAGNEYATTNGVITFQPGEKIKTVTVRVNADADITSNEKFFLNLSSPSNAILGDNIATATIKERTEFISFGSKTYLLSQAQNWGGAVVEARTFGGNLATIETPEEQSFLAGKYAGELVWIGYSDSGVEGTFNWSSEEQSAYTNWENGQPNNFNKVEDFTYLRANGSWDDGNGADSLQGIIEFSGTLQENPSNPTNSNTPILDIDGSGGQPSFARDGLLLSAVLFYYKADRTDYSVLNRFITDTNAIRKTGNDIVNYLQEKLSSFDADGNGETTFARDGLLLSAYLFYYKVDRTDYSVLNRFITASNATRKSGNEIADYLKTFITETTTGANYASVEDLNINYNNNIIGTAGDDILVGDANNNSIVGGVGNDILTGGAGRDTFSFSISSGNDRITDFNVAEDLIQIDASLGLTDLTKILQIVNYQDSIAQLKLGEDDRLIIGLDGALTIDNFSLG
jgi:hypothetical protein